MAKKTSRTPAQSVAQKARSEKNKLRKKAKPHVVKKRSPEATQKKLEEKEMKRQRFLSRRRVKKTVDKNY